MSLPDREPFVLNFNEAETLSKQRALDAVRNQGMQQYRPKNQPRPQQPTNPELSSSATNEGPAAVDSHFVPPTAAEEEQGQEAMERTQGSSNTLAQSSDFFEESYRSAEQSQRDHKEFDEHSNNSFKGKANKGSKGNNFNKGKNKSANIPAQEAPDLSISRGLSRYMQKVEMTSEEWDQEAQRTVNEYMQEIVNSPSSAAGKIFLTPLWQSTYIIDALTKDKEAKILYVTSSRYPMHDVLRSFKDKNTPANMLNTRFYAVTTPSPNICSYTLDVALYIKLYLSALEKDDQATSPLLDFTYVVLDVAGEMSSKTHVLFSVLRELWRKKGNTTTLPKVIIPIAAVHQEHLKNYFGSATLETSKMLHHSLDGLTIVNTTEAAAAVGVDFTNLPLPRKNKEFFLVAYGTIFPALLDRIVRQLSTERPKTEGQLGSSGRCPIIVVYCNTKSFWFPKYDEKLSSFAESTQRNQNTTVKLLQNIESAHKVLDNDGKVGTSQNTIYILTLGLASSIKDLEAHYNVAVAAVIDFGVVERNYSDGDKPWNTTQLGQFNNTPIEYCNNEFAPRDQLEQRAYSADRGLYIQLIPEESVRPGKARYQTPRLPSCPSERLLPTNSVFFSPRTLLAALRVPLGSPNLLTSLVYPTGTQCALNLLKSLGMVESEAPHAPTVIGEFVDRLMDNISIEAGYLALVMASLGLAELGAAIAASATVRITRESHAMRAKYATMLDEHLSAHSVNNSKLQWQRSDLLVDSFYFLKELENKLASVEREVDYSPIEPFTEKGKLTTAEGSFTRLRGKVRKVSFVKSADQESSVTSLCIGSILLDLVENYHIALAVIAAAFASNACEVKDGSPMPLFFETGRKLKIQTISPVPDTHSYFAKRISSLVKPKADSVIVPTGYSCGISTESDSTLITNTMVDKHFFLQALAALRPTLDCVAISNQMICRLTVHHQTYMSDQCSSAMLLALRARLNFLMELLWRKRDLDTPVNSIAELSSHLSLDIPKLIQDAKTLLIQYLCEQSLVAWTDKMNANQHWHRANFCFSEHKSTVKYLKEVEQAMDNSLKGVVVECKTKEEEADEIEEGINEHFLKNGPIEDEDED